jgi:hypothetical protein
MGGDPGGSDVRLISSETDSTLACCSFMRFPYSAIALPNLQMIFGSWNSSTIYKVTVNNTAGISGMSAQATGGPANIISGLCERTDDPTLFWVLMNQAVYIAPKNYSTFSSQVRLFAGTPGSNEDLDGVEFTARFREITSCTQFGNWVYLTTVDNLRISGNLRRFHVISKIVETICSSAPYPLTVVSWQNSLLLSEATTVRQLMLSSTPAPTPSTILPYGL